jgi:hypothetical protein
MVDRCGPSSRMKIPHPPLPDSEASTAESARERAPLFCYQIYIEIHISSTVQWPHWFILVLVHTASRGTDIINSEVEKGIRLSYYTCFLRSHRHPAQPQVFVLIYYHYSITKTSMFQTNTKWSYRLNWVRLRHTQPLIVTGGHPDVISTNLYVKETSFITSSAQAYFHAQ